MLRCDDDGTRVLSGGSGLHSKDNALCLWDAATGALLRTFEDHSGGVTSVAFSSDGTRVISGSNNTTVRIWILRKSSHWRA
jgi:WD40 repeat protein